VVFSLAIIIDKSHSYFFHLHSLKFSWHGSCQLFSNCWKVSFALSVYLFSSVSFLSTAMTTNFIKYPKVVAFDLDGTIWSPDMYMLWGGGSPFSFVNNYNLLDRSGQKVKLLGISGEILDTINTKEEWSDTKVAWVSCTDEPSWADECMNKFKTPMDVPLVERVHEQCIFKDNKRVHFQELKKRTGVEFVDMIFFDNEKYNIESVSKLGVCSVYCPDGMTRAIWEKGIDLWKKRRQEVCL